MLKRLDRKLHQLPDHVSIELYNPYKKKVVFDIKIKLDQLGYTHPENVSNAEIFDKVKSLLGMIKYVGDSDNDFKE